MELRFDYTSEDFAALNYNIAWNDRDKGKNIAFSITLLCIYFLLSAWFESKGLFSKRNTFVDGVCLTVLLWYLYLLICWSRWGMRKLIYAILKKDPKRFANGPHTLFLKDTNVTLSAPHSVSILEWPMFSELRETKDYFYLFSNKLQAIIIPKRTFTSEQEQLDTKTFILQKLQEQKASHGQSTIP